MTSKEIECKIREKEKYKINHENPKNNGKIRPSQTSQNSNITNNEKMSTSRASHSAPPKKNIAQKRLKKLRAKLEAEIKMKEKVGKIEMKELTNESVVKIEHNDVFQKKMKNIPSITKSNKEIVNRRNIAAERIKKLKEELQATFPSIPRPPPSPLSTQLPSPPLPPPSLRSTQHPHPLLSCSPVLPLSNDQDMSMDIDVSMDEVTAFNTSSQTVNDHGRIAHSPKKASKESNILNPHELNNLDTYYNDEILKIREEPNYKVLHSHFITDVDMTLSVPVGDLLLVIDTNIFLTDLKFVQDFLKNSIPPYKSPILVLPWPIIQELDYLMKKKDKNLANQARYANTFIHDYLKKKHPRIFGQSLIDFQNNYKKVFSVDDFILQYCLQFRSSDNNAVLITNDRNLSSKAMLNQLPVYTSAEFQNEFPFSK